MGNIISEIDRQKELMGLQNKRLIVEQTLPLTRMVSRLKKIFRNAPDPASVRSQNNISWQYTLPDGTKKTITLGAQDYNDLLTWLRDPSFHTSGGGNYLTSRSIGKLIDILSEIDPDGFLRTFDDILDELGEKDEGTFLRGLYDNVEQKGIDVYDYLNQQINDELLSRIIEKRYDQLRPDIVGGKYKGRIRSKDIKPKSDITIGGIPIGNFIAEWTPKALNLFRQKFLGATPAGGRKGVRAWFGEFYKGSESIQDKILERIGIIQEKLNAGEFVKGDLYELLNSVSLMNKWASQKIDVNFEKFLENNEVIRNSKEWIKIKESPEYKKFIKDVELSVSEYTNKMLWSRMIAPIKALTPIIREEYSETIKKLGKEVEVLKKEWKFNERFVNLVLFKSPLTYWEVLSDTAKYGRKSGILSILTHYVVYNGLGAVLIGILKAAFENNAYIQRVNARIERAKELCETLKAQDPNSPCSTELQKLQELTDEDIWGYIKESLPFVKMYEEKKFSLKGVISDFTYLDEIYNAIKWLSNNLTKKNIITEIEKNYTKALLEKNSFLCAELKKIKINCEEFETVDDALDRLEQELKKIQEKEKNKPSDKTQTQDKSENFFGIGTTIDEVKSKIAPTKIGFIAWALTDGKTEVGEFNPITDIENFYDSPFIQVELKNKNMYSWDGKQWYKEIL